MEDAMVSRILYDAAERGDVLRVKDILKIATADDINHTETNEVS